MNELGEVAAWLKTFPVFHPTAKCRDIGKTDVPPRLRLNFCAFVEFDVQVNYWNTV